jgi:hypothetical protein
MRWRAACVLALTGCSFQSSASPATDASAPGLAPDAAIDGPPVAQAAPFCDPDDASVVVCFDFDDGTAGDKSAHHLTVHTDNLQFVPGQVGQAVKLAADSAADLDDSSVFDVASLTIEAWIDPDQLPADTADILDVNNQYALQVKADGSLHCILSNTNASVSGLAAIPPQRWTHVACTFDGASQVGVLYVNGTQLNSTGGNQALATDGNTGMSLGGDNGPPALKPGPPTDRFVGVLDQVRLASRARTSHEICLDAGRTSCP